MVHNVFCILYNIFIPVQGASVVFSVVAGVSGVVSPGPSGYQHSISAGGFVAPGLGHQVTAVVVGET